MTASLVNNNKDAAPVNPIITPESLDNEKIPLKKINPSTKVKMGVRLLSRPATEEVISVCAIAYI